MLEGASEGAALLAEKALDGGGNVARVADAFVRLLPSANAEAIAVAAVAETSAGAPCRFGGRQRIYGHTNPSALPDLDHTVCQETTFHSSLANS